MDFWHFPPSTAYCSTLIIYFTSSYRQKWFRFSASPHFSSSASATPSEVSWISLCTGLLGHKLRLSACTVPLPTSRFQTPKRNAEGRIMTFMEHSLWARHWDEPGDNRDSCSQLLFSGSSALYGLVWHILHRGWRQKRISAA